MYVCGNVHMYVIYMYVLTMRMGHLYFDNWLDDVTDDVMEEEAVIGNQEGSERDQL